MKSIERGCTEAQTREGEFVTQIKWFETNNKFECAGVLNKDLHTWTGNGKYYENNTRISNLDIFSIPEYEYQWLFRDKDRKMFYTTNHYKSLDEIMEEYIVNEPKDFILIPESKREVQ